MGENPVDENNLFGALRYLISRLDSRFIGKLRGKAKSEGRIETETIDTIDLEETAKAVHGIKTRPSLIFGDQEGLWTTLN